MVSSTTKVYRRVTTTAARTNNSLHPTQKGDFWGGMGAWRTSFHSVLWSVSLNKGRMNLRHAWTATEIRIIEVLPLDFTKGDEIICMALEVYLMCRDPALLD